MAKQSRGSDLLSIGRSSRHTSAAVQIRHEEQMLRGRRIRGLERGAGLARLTPLQDQIAAGSEMWVLNSIIFLIPAVLLIVHIFTPPHLQQRASAL